MDPGGSFNFQSMPNHKFSSLEKADIAERLGKWSMIDGLKIQAYSFDKPFRKYMEGDFLTDFLGCQNVVSTLMKKTPDHTFSPVGIPASVIKFLEVKCTLTSLQLFEKLKKDNLVLRKNGSIMKCMPRYIRADKDISSGDGFEIEIADNLRMFILCCEDDDIDNDDWEEIRTILTEDEKKEFLFLLFSHLVVGGSLCQYEDNIEPYIQATKLLYKDLIAVASVKNIAKSANEQAGEDSVRVISHVYKIHSARNDFAGEKDLLFNHSYINNFFYVIVNPLKQVCYTFYHHV